MGAGLRATVLMSGTARATECRDVGAAEVPIAKAKSGSRKVVACIVGRCAKCVRLKTLFLLKVSILWCLEGCSCLRRVERVME
jgi:hypothetical protein